MEERKNFIKVIEDFKCEQCGKIVKGSGYTDHCPSCLWGKHVDNVPGDRSSTCKGALRPQASTYSRGSYTIEYKCEKCGVRKRFKAAADDDSEKLIELAGRISFG